MYRKSNLICLFFLIGLVMTSCRERIKQVDFFKNNQNSILKILLTDYSYKDYSIFKIVIPFESYRGFPNSGYFAVQNKAFYYLNLDERCSENYKNGQYTINKPKKSLESEPNFCDIDFRFFFSTDAKMNDTISHIAKEWDWIILKNKFFDPTIKDTAYIFEKKSDLGHCTGFSFSYSQGFMGLYTLKFNQEGNIVRIENAAGRIYQDTLKTLYPNVKTTLKNADFNADFKDVDLSMIKEFQKN